MVFLSTLPARGATGQGWATRADINISIHAPREGSDGYPALMSENCIHFYPRSPRGEQHEHVPVINKITGISIHAPREGSDTARAAIAAHRGTFLSTLPARGATDHGKQPNVPAVISIHAPREGSDVKEVNEYVLRTISIHAPREGSDI